MDKDTKLKQHYKHLENKRRLSAYTEFNSINLGAGASFLLFCVVLFNAFDFQPDATYLDTRIALVSLAFLFPAVLQLILGIRIRLEVLKKGAVGRGTRFAGFILIPFIFSFNFFAAAAGFMLIKKQRTIEYTLAFYSLLISLAIMVISMLNIFKPYVSDTFLPGMGLLAVLSVFYAIATVLSAVWVKDKQTDKRMIPVAVISIASAVTGNIFALMLGIVLLTRILNPGKPIEWIDIVKRLFRNNMSVFGMLVVIFLLSLSVCSILTFDYSVAIDNNYGALRLFPSLMYPFGTDDVGRCVFTRIVFGARISLIVGFISTVIPIVVGCALGAIAGFYGNKADNIIMRALDVLYAVPGILMAIAIIAAFGANTVNLILALSIGAVPMYARTMRASVMSVSNNEFVEAAKACGARNYMIIIKHIIPNSLAPIIVRSTISIGGAVLSTSSLSFLGIGIEPHIPEWGNILKSGSQFLETLPYLAIYPGLAIVLIVLAFNYFGDGLRDALDPKLK